MRVAVFLCDFALQGYLVDLLRSWRQAGHHVLLCRKRPRHGGTDTADLQLAGIDVVEIAGDDFGQRLAVLADRALHAAGGTGSLSAWLQARRFEATRALGGFDLYLGVEKTGLVVADRLGRRHGVPHAYYSLELYVEDHPNHARFAHLRRAEAAANRRAVATVIQDARRAAVLAHANALEEHRFLYLPVGCSGAGAAPLRAPGPQATVLYVGLLNQRRRIDELVALADHVGPDVRLHLHGPPHGRSIEPVARDRLLVTCELLSESALEALVAAADIGMALYFNEPVNERLTAFASHKLALYLKHGKPVIVPRNESYGDLMQQFECGVMVDDYAEIPAAIARIRANYRAYAEAARRAFEACYDIDRHGPGVLAALAGAGARLAQQRGTT